MGPFTQSASTGIIGFETNDAGHITRGRISAVPSTGLDTTTLTYSAGCQITESSTSRIYTNVGTSTTPYWVLGTASLAMIEVTVSAANTPLLFGGTNIQAIAAPPGGAAQAWVVQGMVLEYIGTGGTGFTGGGSTVRAVYSSGGTNVAAQMSLGTSTFFGTATKVLQADSSAPAAGQTVVPGAALYLDNTGAAYAGGGTSPSKVTLWYSLVTIV